MPSTTHTAAFGANVLDHLPAPLRKSWSTGNCTISVCTGRICCSITMRKKSTPVAALGNAMRRNPGRMFFDRARRVVHEEADRELRWPTRWALCAILR